jgi:glycosyltransferase involved in cell wall biosynthesis
MADIALPTIHILVPFHQIPDEKSSHCAFTGKAIRLSKMLQPLGYRCIEYGNKGSTTAAETKIVMLNEEEYKRFYQPEVKSPGNQAQIGTPGWHTFNQRLCTALTEHAKPGDIVAHVFGHAHQGLVQAFPALIHVETGIGYPDGPFGAYRIFESEAWRHFHWGRMCSPGGVIPARADMHPANTWVVPNYFDPADWPLVEAPGRDVVFMARFVVDKGIDMLRTTIKAWQKKHPDDPTRFVLAGMGDFAGWYTNSVFTPEEAARVDYRGVVLGKDRAALVGNARAFWGMSTFVEPFGGAGVEAMLTGTPVIAASFGAWTETVQHGVTGFHCRTVDDVIAAVEQAPTLKRAKIAQTAAERFSLQACGALYDKIFRRLSTRTSLE